MDGKQRALLIKLKKQGFELEPEATNDPLKPIRFAFSKRSFIGELQTCYSDPVSEIFAAEVLELYRAVDFT